LFSNLKKEDTKFSFYKIKNESCSLEFLKGKVIFGLTFVNTTRFKSGTEIRTGSRKRTQQTLHRNRKQSRGISLQKMASP
jgi:hypothetical protein